MRNCCNRLQCLEGIRGVAILSVFLYHALGASFGVDQLGWNGWFRDFHIPGALIALYPLTYGFAGVSIFFVLSGFCIHLSYQSAKETGWLGFFDRRFFRLYPPYLLAILIFYFCWPFGSLDRSPRLLQLAMHFFAVHNLCDDTFFGINPSFWSIGVEIQLYGIYPLLLLLTKWNGWRNGLILVGVLELGLRSANAFSSIYFGEPLPWFAAGSPFAYWFSWSIGAYIAHCYLEGRPCGLARVHFGLVAGLAIAIPLFKPSNSFAFFGFSLAAAVAVDRVISARWKIPQNPLVRLGWRQLSFLGIVSYSFYLFHQPFVNLFSYMNPLCRHPRLSGMLEHFLPINFQSNQPLVKFGLGCSSYLVVLFVSYLVYRAIEQPSIALGKSLLRKSGRGNRLGSKARISPVT